MSRDLKVLIITAIVGLACWFYGPVVGQLVDSSVWSLSTSWLIISYSLPVAVLLAIGLGGYTAIMEVYHRQKMNQADLLHRLNEAGAIGFTVESLSSRKSAVILHPHRQPQLVSHAEPTESPVLIEDQPPCVLDIMMKLDRILLVGGTGSGKTEIMKHYVSRLAESGNQLTIIDPHSPSKLAGVDCIGARLDFGAIEAKMVEIMLSVSRAYESGQIAGDGNLAGGNQWLIVEEFRDIRKQLGEVAEQFLEVMLVRGRKAGYRFVIVSQNDSVSSLGLEGDKGLLKGCERVEIRRDLRNDSRMGLVGWSAADRIACQVPGMYRQPFADIPPGQLVADPPRLNSLTDSQKALALAYIASGVKIKNQLYKLANVSKNALNSTFIDNMLELA